MATGQAVPGTNVPSGVGVSPGGGQGVPGSTASTALTAGFTVPALGSTVSVTVVDASWVIVGQMLYIAGAGGGTIAGDFQVQSKAGNTLTLLNLPASGGATGGGDMFKAVYDVSNRGFVDKAATVPWAGVQNPPLASPSGAGLLATTSGNTTDYVGGDNACHVLTFRRPLAIRTFTASGTYTPTPGMTSCIIECVGGGGGGGPITGAANMSNGGGGGGGGGYSRKLATAAQIGASQVVTIGAGGGSGANGGATSVGSLCLANGGLGAPGMGGNYGGSVTGAIGDLCTSGGCGVSWAQYVQGGVIYNSISGCGGSSFFGGGGPGAGGTSNGNAGQLYGGGGGGGCAFNSATTQTGGAGAAGIVVITEYV